MTEPTTPPAESGLAASPRFVRFSILLTLLLFMATVALIGYRWMVTNEPSAILIIDGSSALNGAEIEVQSLDEPTKFKVAFGEADRISMPFYLDPGAYLVRITRDGQLLMDAREITLRKNELGRIDLTQWEQKLTATTQSTTQP
ncbi:MAG TPA: hypothetical protein VF669_12600 [Tepidisphaeraceae bacterium]